MGTTVRRMMATAVAWVIPVLLLAGSTGCQPSRAQMSDRLVARMSLIDFSGLAPARPIQGLEVSAAVPRTWELLPASSHALFTHRQWRSPDRATAVGVVHLTLPLPMSAKTIVWLAKSKYGGDAAAKPDPTPVTKPDGTKPRVVPGGPPRLTNEWSDPIGREWVEAENDRYHVRGYVVTCGFDAWVVYTGYKRQGVPDPVGRLLAERSMESVVPDPLAPHKGG